MARISDNDLIVWIKNFVAVGKDDPAKYGLTAAQVSELEEYGNALDAAVSKREAAELAFRADVAAQQESRTAADPFVSFLTATVKKNPSVSDADKLALGIEINKPATHTPPVTPASIIANGYENGTNVVRWDRSGNKTTTQFILEYREAAETEFKFLAAVSETSYTHEGVTPGVQIAYRVKAQRAGEESAYSNPAVVYMK